jgi:hypothetical protein
MIYTSLLLFLAYDWQSMLLGWGRECIQNFDGETLWGNVHFEDQEKDVRIKLRLILWECKDVTWIEVSQDRVKWGHWC